MKHLRLLALLGAVLFATFAHGKTGPCFDFIWKHTARATTHGKETKEQLKERTKTILTALRYEAKSPGRKAAVLTLWEAEAKFARDVHAGDVGRWGSDDGRAKCLGQIHVNRKVPKDMWETLGGLDLAATRRCAWATITILEGKMRHCNGAVRWNMADVQRGFHAYAVGTCPKEGPYEKAVQRAQVWAELHAGLKE